MGQSSVLRNKPILVIYDHRKPPPVSFSAASAKPRFLFQSIRTSPLEVSSSNLWIQPYRQPRNLIEFEKYICSLENELTFCRTKSKNPTCHFRVVQSNATSHLFISTWNVTENISIAARRAHNDKLCIRITLLRMEKKLQFRNISR